MFNKDVHVYMLLYNKAWMKVRVCITVFSLKLYTSIYVDNHGTFMYGTFTLLQR